MAIAPIAPIAVSGPLQVGNVTGAASAVADGGAGGADFAASMTAALDDVAAAAGNADALAVQAATGDLTAIQDYVVASTESQLLTQLTVSVRDRAVEAFSEIMRMQV